MATADTMAPLMAPIAEQSNETVFEPMPTELFSAKQHASWLWVLVEATNKLQDSILQGQLTDINSAKNVMDVMMDYVGAMNKDLAEKAQDVINADGGEELAKAQAAYQEAQANWQSGQGVLNTTVSTENSAVQTDAQTQSRIIEYSGSIINVAKVLGNLLASVY